jgi:arylamine N-acetyltransferase
MTCLRAYSGTGRVNKSPPKSDIVDYTPIAHMVLFVQPVTDSNETYLVDVGFGSTNLSQPILLSNAETNVVWGAVPPDRHRLTRGAHPSSCLGEIPFSFIAYALLSVSFQVE